jgi:hypothetical protein
VIAFGIVVSLLPLLCGSAVAASGASPLVADLVADQHHVVGKVVVSSDAAALTVEFRLSGTGDWCLIETHLHVADSPAGIPQRNGNPVPGRFAHGAEHGCVPSFSYSVPIEWPAGTKLAIAAHAVVEVPGGVAAVAGALPASASMRVTYPYPGAPSYVGAAVWSGGALDGSHRAWCVDTSHVILEHYTYRIAPHSTGSPLPAGLVDHPESVDLLNWVLAQRFVGRYSPSGLGAYAYGDVQRAVWMLVEDTVVDDGLGVYSLARAGEIAAAARASGEGFVPGCGDVFGVLLQPVNASGATVGQVLLAETTFAELGVPCEPVGGTAWAAGAAFAGKNWATYLEYVL